MHISVDYASTGPKRDNAAERLDGLNDFEVYVVGLLETTEGLKICRLDRAERRGEGALCGEVLFYADISWKSRYNIDINV